MKFYFHIQPAHFEAILKAAGDAYAVYQAAKAACEEAREQYGNGKISQDTLLTVNQSNQNRVEEAQEKGLRIVAESMENVRRSLDEQQCIAPADMDKADYRVLQTDIIQSKKDLLALKQRNLSSNLIRREVETYAFGRGLKDPAFVNQTNAQDIEEAVVALGNAAKAVLGDTSCRGTYGGALLNIILTEPGGLHGHLVKTGVLEG